MNHLTVKFVWVRIAIVVLWSVLALVGCAGENTNDHVVVVNFDRDTPGQSPATGGDGQPSELLKPDGTSIDVLSDANGITSQPVVLKVPAEHLFPSVVTRFEPVSSGVVRIEATVAFDRLVDGLFLQTTAGSGSFPFAVLTRLITTADGEIQDDKTRMTVGWYAPNQPFRVRVDIDMTTKSWAVSIDREMNGFGDDPTVSNLPFENPDAVVPTVGAVWGSLLVFPTASAGETSVAYDDIRIQLPEF